MKTENATSFCKSGLKVIEIETKSISHLRHLIDARFERACQLLLQCKGRVIVSGVGKSGHIGKKIAASFASTGTPAFFIHPTEAIHGDMGMITKEDVVLILSYSGETSELIALLPALRQLKTPLIAIVGNAQSTLAKQADLTLAIHIEQEACPLGLAPTASTTASLVLGDALAVALLDARGFTAADFARFHPGGRLGRQLLLQVRDLMHQGPEIPMVSSELCIEQALLEITQKRLGMTAVMGAQQELLGIFTDGDLRRTLDKKINISCTPIRAVMTLNAKSVPPDHLALDALRLMERHKITSLLVVEDEKLAGVLHLHDLLSAGLL